MKELAAGSGIAFCERGEYELKGVPGLRRLFAAVELHSRGRRVLIELDARVAHQLWTTATGN